MRLARRVPANRRLVAAEEERPWYQSERPLVRLTTWGKCYLNAPALALLGEETRMVSLAFERQRRLALVAAAGVRPVAAAAQAPLHGRTGRGRPYVHLLTFALACGAALDEDRVLEACSDGPGTVVFALPMPTTRVEEEGPPDDRPTRRPAERTARVGGLRGGTA